MHVKISPRHKALYITPSTSALYPDNGVLRLETTLDEVDACRLTLRVPLTAYQEIDRAMLFNLTHEVRGPRIGEAFRDNEHIELELLLQPRLLPDLLQHASTTEEALAELIERSRIQQPFDNVIPLESHRADNDEEPPAGVDPFLYTENWLCLSVRQSRGEEHVGFDTFWSYFPDSRNREEETSTEQEIERVIHFIDDLLEARLSKIVAPLQNATADLDSLFAPLLAHLMPDEVQLSHHTQSLYQAMLTFFRKENWAATHDEDESALGAVFRGENGQWTCLGRVLVPHDQFVFYSVCPLIAPEGRRTAVAELITRANSGMVIGNFELDFDDGEICYKTSIDVRDDRISMSLFRHVVYTNVFMMDTYLPALRAVIEGDMDPQVALAVVERLDVQADDSE